MQRVDLSAITRIVGYLILVGGLLFVATYVVIAVIRMPYPFELEWFEGAMMANVERVRSGLPLYVAPSMEFVPLLYTPLYYYLAAGVSVVTGTGFLPLRLLSFAASVGLFAVMYLCVRHEARDRYSALLGVSLFAATFAIGGAWFDVGRNDTLFLLFTLAGAHLLQRSQAVPPAAVAGSVLALAILTKQSALLVAVPLGLYLLLGDWKRGLAFGIGLVALLGPVSIAFDTISDGWFRYYTVEMPRGHALLPDQYLGFWTEDLVGRLPIATITGLGYLAYRTVSRTRRSGFLLALSVGLIATAWSSRIHDGGFDNVLIPAYLAMAILAAMAFQEVAAKTRVEKSLSTDLLGLAAYAAAGLQFLLLVYHPASHIPTAADRQAGETLVKEIEALEGEVWIPGHGYLARMAGKPTLAHSAQIHDVLRSGESEAKEMMAEALLTSLAEQRFSWILMEWSFPEECPERANTIDGINWTCPEVHSAYRRERLTTIHPDSFWPLTGVRTRPLAFYAAKDRWHELVWPPAAPDVEGIVWVPLGIKD